jgi:phosphatidate cytidylyltransferase
MKRVATALVLIPLLVWSVLLGPRWVFVSLLAAIGILAIREFDHIVQAHGFTPPGLPGMAAGLALLFAPSAFSAAVAIVLIGMALAIRAGDLRNVLAAAAVFVLGVFYIFGAWRCAMALREMSPHWLMFALLLSWAGDTAAFYVGRAFGRHKMAARVSPAKSWEGAIASVAGSMLAGALYMHYLLPGVSLAMTLGLSVVGNIAGQLGDLFESALKRGAGVKDSGSSLPGHGGWLDRIDASLFGVPAVYVALTLILNLGPTLSLVSANRDRAVRRGLEFLYSTATNPQNFDTYGPDIIDAFQYVASTIANPELAAYARDLGRERALEWRRTHREVPVNARPRDIAGLVFGSDTADLLGVPDANLRSALRDAAARIPNQAYFGFDPAREPPPSDLPEPCRQCGKRNARGAHTCIRCGAKLSIYSRHAVFTDALIHTYTGDQYGVPLGGRYADVLRWLPSMRPYPRRGTGHAWEYFDAIYAVTHVVYTYNGYNVKRISPRCFPEEFEYLKSNLPAALADKDPEILGEFLDSLRAFGLTESDPLIRQGIDQLLASQNPDGSWGDPTDLDPYDRYHTTWAGVGGIQDYRWTEVLPCP